jgi:hypothetical protein
MKFGLAMGNPLSTARVNEFGGKRNLESAVWASFRGRIAEGMEWSIEHTAGIPNVLP